MVDKADDVIGALAEGLEELIDTIPELEGKSLYVYDPVQLSTNQQRFSLPAVIFHYAGMLQTGQKHTVYFHVYLIGRAESLTQIKGSTTNKNTTVTAVTTLLQSLRKGIACNTSSTNRDWKLESELPNFGVDDKLIYRQRWSTSYQIIR